MGICYNLSSSLTDDRNIKPSPANTVFVRGKQRLDVQGPRLNNTKEEKSSKAYGPDRRLDLVVQPEMPQLQVWRFGRGVSKAHVRKRCISYSYGDFTEALDKAHLFNQTFFIN